VLTGQYGDYGLPPGRSSFAMHAMVAKHYLNGACFPVGGCERIFETIAKPILDTGSEIFTNAAVEEILLSKGKYQGVRMAGGSKLYAPVVISGVGIHNTFNHLVKDSFKGQAEYKGQIGDLKASASHIGLYLGFEESPDALGLERPNFWIYPDNGYDHDANLERYLQDPESEFPMVYISFPSAKDPDWSRRYPGKSTVDVITMAPYGWFSKWEGTRWMKRGEDYEAFKEKLSNRLLEKVFEYLPQLKDKVAHCELSTPLSTKNFCSYAQGEIYGIEHTPDRFKSPILRPFTPVKNLFLTGQDIVSCGIAGAMMSGLITASAMQKKNLLKGII
jgi:all-trans-retinol 13,14-reductase